MTSATSLPAVSLLRDELGASAALWAPADHRVEADRWSAISGAHDIGYNLVVCHGSASRDVVADSIEAIATSKVPTLLALAGEASNSSQVADDAGWIRVGDRAFMARSNIPAPVDPAAHRATPEELPAVRQVLATTFETELDMAAVALPDPRWWPPGSEVWLIEEAGRPAAVTAAVRVGSGVAIWSTATLPDCQQRGYGRRLHQSVLAAALNSGADHSVLLSSQVGEPFYRSLGYQVVERWQQWSRPRWVGGFQSPVPAPEPPPDPRPCRE